MHEPLAMEAPHTNVVVLEPEPHAGSSIPQLGHNKQTEAENIEHPEEEEDDSNTANPSKGEWWPCKLKTSDMQDLQAEGYIKEELAWRFVADEPFPAPAEGERVITKALIDRGFSFPPSEFFTEVLDTFKVQPHHISPNSITALSGFVTVCEGYLGIRPRVDLLMYFFCIKKEPVRAGGPLARTSSITLKVRENRVFPFITPHQSARFWNSFFFYCKDQAAPGKAQGLPPFQDVIPEEVESWNMSPEISGNPLLERCARRIAKLVEMGLTGQDTTLSWLKRRIQPLQHRDRLMHEYSGIKDPMRVTQGELVSKAIDDRLKKIIEVKKDPKIKIREYKYSLNMYENGKCPDVSSDHNKILLVISVTVSDIIPTSPFCRSIPCRTRN